jgi:hypothetical protein
MKDGKIVSTLALARFSLEHLLKEQNDLERKWDRQVDEGWLDETPRGKESL